MDIEKVKRLYDLCYEKRNGAVKRFQSVGRLLPFISDAYPGIWLETSAYGSLMLARMETEGLQIAENTVNTFIDYQTSDGQLPSISWMRLPVLPILTERLWGILKFRNAFPLQGFAC